jgi:hypothetical protein
MSKSLRQTVSAAVASATGLLASAAPVLAQLNSVSVTKPEGFAGDFGALVNSVLSIVMVIAALLVFFYLIWGGIEWITSGGDKGQTEKARNKITAAVIGLIILAASFAVLNLALNFIGFDNLDQVFDEANSLS